MTRRDIERIEISFLSLWSLQRVIQGNYRVIQGQCHSQAKRKSETKKENAGRRNGAWSHFLAAADLSFKHASIAWERQMRRSWVVREANFVRQGKLCFVGGPWFNATKDKFVLLSCVAWTHLCPRTVSEKKSVWEYYYLDLFTYPHTFAMNCLDLKLQNRFFILFSTDISRITSAVKEIMSEKYARDRTDFFRFGLFCGDLLHRFLGAVFDVELGTKEKRILILSRYLMSHINPWKQRWHLDAYWTSKWISQSIRI